MNKEVDDKLLLSETLYLITKFLKSSDGLSEAADALENELVILIIINHCTNHLLLLLLLL
jgi:hypothetical protein